MFIALNLRELDIERLGLRERERVSYAIDNVLRARYEGMHYVQIDTAGIKKLRRENMLSSLGVEVANDISARSSEWNGFRKSLPFYLELTPFLGLRDRVVRGHQSILRADLMDFGRYRASLESVLLCENLADCKYYRRLGEALIHKLGHVAVRLEFEDVLGGGSTTAEVFKAVCERERIVLAIGDSDVRCPGGSKGSTATTLQGCKPAQEFQVTHILSVRTVENLLSDELVDVVMAPHPRGAGSPVKWLRERERLFGGGGWRRYADLKDGLFLRDIQKMQGAEFDYWNSFADVAFPRGCPGVCPAKDCDCVVVVGYGRNILGRVVEWVDKQISRQPKKFQWAKWFGLTLVEHEELAELLVCWGCAPPPMA